MKPLSQMTDAEYSAWFAQTGGKMDGPHRKARSRLTPEQRREAKLRAQRAWYYRNRARRSA